MIQQNDEPFMAEALKEARKAFDKGEVPVGAVIVYKGRIIARAYNQMELLKDATAHAEILSITQASSVLDNWRLTDVVMYVTKEPCPMCAGAMINSRIKKLVFGAYDKEMGAAGSTMNITTNKLFRHEIEVSGGIMEEECKLLLQYFFKKQRLLDKAVNN